MFKIILGIILFAAGFFIMAKTEWVLSNFGRMGFFEQHFGTEGGSRLGYKLIALIITFIGIVLVTGLYDDFMGWFFGPVIRMISGEGL